MKKLLTLLLAFFLVLGLVACTHEDKPKPGPEKDVTIELWHTYTEGQKEFLDKAVKDFNDTHEHITVVAKEQANQGFTDTVYNAVINNNGPDLIIHYASEAAKYIDDNKVADLGKYVPEGFATTIPETIYQEMTGFDDGKLHVLPLFVSGPVLYINTAIYKELGLTVPHTWKELADNSRIIKEHYPKKYGFGVDSKTDIVHALIAQTGNELIDVKNRKVTFNTPEVADQLKEFGKAVYEGAYALHATGDYFSSDFNSGLVASMISSIAGMPYVEIKDYEIAPIPQGGKVEWTPAWDRGVIVFSYGDEAREKAAAEFALYLASPEVNAGFCAAANYASPYKATVETETYKKHIADNPALEALRPEIGGAIAPISGSAQIRKILENLSIAVSTGADVDVNKLLADAEVEGNAALAGE